MTVKKLIEELVKYPDTEFTYGLVNSVRSDEINFKDDPYDDEVLARDMVVIIDEE